MSQFVTLDEAARRLDLSREQTRQLRTLTFVNDLSGAKVLEADVARVERQRKDAKRNEEIVVAQRPAIVAEMIAEEEEWLESVRAQGYYSLALDDRANAIEEMKAELELYTPEAAHLDAARWGGENYARMCDEHEEWLKEKRAQMGSSAGPWLERAESRVREERAMHARARTEAAR